MARSRRLAPKASLKLSQLMKSRLWRNTMASLFGEEWQTELAAARDTRRVA